MSERPCCGDPGDCDDCDGPCFEDRCREALRYGRRLRTDIMGQMIELVADWPSEWRPFATRRAQKRYEVLRHQCEHVDKALVELTNLCA